MPHADSVLWLLALLPSTFRLQLASVAKQPFFCKGNKRARPNPDDPYDYQLRASFALDGNEGEHPDKSLYTREGLQGESSRGRAIWPSLALGRNEPLTPPPPPPPPLFPTIRTKGFYATMMLFAFIAIVQNIYIPILAFVLTSNVWGLAEGYLGKLYVGLLLAFALPFQVLSIRRN